MVTQHEPMRIDWTLASPMVHPAQDLHLDGILAAAAIDEAGISELSDPAGARILAELPLAGYTCSTGGCWCASRLRMAWCAPPTLEPWVRRPDYTHTAEQQGHTWSGRADQIPVGTGPYRTYFESEHQQHAHRAQAWCIGDPERIRALLNRVHQIGPKRKTGHGRVAECTVTVDTAAHQHWRDRILPDPRAGHEPIVARTYPPYWATEHQQVAYAPITPAILE